MSLTVKFIMLFIRINIIIFAFCARVYHQFFCRISLSFICKVIIIKICLSKTRIGMGICSGWMIIISMLCQNSKIRARGEKYTTSLVRLSLIFNPRSSFPSETSIKYTPYNKCRFINAVSLNTPLIIYIIIVCTSQSNLHNST